MEKIYAWEDIYVYEFETWEFFKIYAYICKPYFIHLTYNKTLLLTHNKGWKYHMNNYYSHLKLTNM